MLYKSYKSSIQIPCKLKNILKEVGSLDLKIKEFLSFYDSGLEAI